MNVSQMNIFVPEKTVIRKFAFEDLKPILPSIFYPNSQQSPINHLEQTAPQSVSQNEPAAQTVTPQVESQTSQLPTQSSFLSASQAEFTLQPKVDHLTSKPEPQPETQLETQPTPQLESQPEAQQVEQSADVCFEQPKVTIVQEQHDSKTSVQLTETKTENIVIKALQMEQKPEDGKDGVRIEAKQTNNLATGEQVIVATKIPLPSNDSSSPSTSIPLGSPTSETSESAENLSQTSALEQIQTKIANRTLTKSELSKLDMTDLQTLCVQNKLHPEFTRPTLIKNLMKVASK